MPLRGIFVALFCYFQDVAWGQVALPPNMPNALNAREPYVKGRPCWKEIMCKPGSQCVFEGDGIDCAIEVHSQALVWQYVPEDAVVLEMGARFGTVSCTISKKQNYAGMRVSMEPDPMAFKALEANTRREGCIGLNVNGVAARQNYTWQFAWHGGYASGLRGVAQSGPSSVTGYRVAQLANMLSIKAGRHVQFDTLVVDCEKCFTQFLKDEEEFMRHPSLKRIVYELDERTDAMVKHICSFGFGVVFDELDSMLPPNYVARHKRNHKGLRQVIFTRDATTCNYQ